MTRHFFITVFFAGLFSCSFGQSLNNKVFQKFITADSVIIVSHLSTYIPTVDEKTNQRIGSYRLVEKNKVNFKIIKEQHRLDKKEIDSLALIMIEANTDSTIKDIGCFMPHHGILIYKKSKCSFFDICFGFWHFMTSKDITLSDEISDKTWLHLFHFFRNRKLNYELTGDTIEQQWFLRLTTLRTIAESPIKEAPVNDLLMGAFGYCLLTVAWLSATLTLS